MSRSVEDANELDDAGSMELIGDTSDKPTEDKKPAEDKPDLTGAVAQLEAQLDAEKQKSEYWKSAADRAAQRPTTSRLPTDEGDDPEEDENDDDLVEILAKGDKKKIKFAFARLGFVSKDEVEQTLDKKWATVETAAQVQARHPEITDPNSQLHQETLRQIDGLRKQGVDVPNLLGIAADLAYSTLARAGKIKAKDEPAETDAERIERVGSQQGQVNRSRRNPSEGSDNDGLSDSQKLICKKFGIPEKDYASRANRGVRLAGVPKG